MLTALIFFVLFAALMVPVAIANGVARDLLAPEALLTPLFFIGLALFIMSIAFVSEFVEYKKQQASFSRRPFSELDQIGFIKTVLFKKRFWKLYKEVFAANFGGFLVVADIHTKSDIKFTFLTTNPVTGQLPPPSGLRDISIRGVKEGLMITVPGDSMSTPSIHQLQSLLAQVAQDLSKHHYQPIASLSRYENVVIREMFSKGLNAGLGLPT